jgi:RyR domain
LTNDEIALFFGIHPFEYVVAAICHEANRAYCLGLGDATQPMWVNAPGWQRDSAIAGVKFHLENPDAAPSHSHECWLAEKEAAGWKWGPEKDPEKKEHPCMVPFHELPLHQQHKDVLFSSICKAFVPLYGKVNALVGE